MKPGQKEEEEKILELLESDEKVMESLRVLTK